jgi:hypothetical protein
MGFNKDETGAPGRNDRAPTDPGDPRGQPGKPSASLRALTGPWVGQSFTLGPKNLIGRSREADLCLEDDSVSRRHAEIDQIGGIWVLRDLSSVNGTLVNGNEVSGQIELWSGDVIRLGDIEMAYQDTIGRQRAAPAPPPSTGEFSEAPPTRLPTGKVIVLGGLTAALAVGGFLALRKPRAPNPPKFANTAPSVSTQLPKLEKPSELQRFLTECRTYASGAEPDWSKAELACNQTLDLDPINAEANSLLKQVALEKRAFLQFTQGQKAAEQRREEEAIKSFAAIPQESIYHRKAKQQIAASKIRLKNGARQDCLKYAHSRLWTAAAKRCEQYMGLACPEMRREELVPPPGKHLSLSGKLRKNQWRPKDSTYVTFLQVRQKVHPRGRAWVCPHAPLAQEAPRPPDARAEVQSALQQRFSDQGLAQAMLRYWEGKPTDALVALQKMRDDPGEANSHQAVDGLRKGIALVDQLFRNGEGAIQAGDPERAKDPFLEALKEDRKLMKELSASWPSFFQRTIRQDMASRSYERGKYWADRTDLKRACRIWKIGYEFYRGNLQLLQAVKQCTDQARELLLSAKGCGDVAVVVDLSVEGDGLAAKAQDKRVALRCP